MMKKLLVLISCVLLLFPMQARAQDGTDTIRYLVISEASTRGGILTLCFVELTNRGTEAVNLSQFELGSAAWTSSPKIPPSALASSTPPATPIAVCIAPAIKLPLWAPG